MRQFAISPAERPPITNLGPNSQLPEMLGVDVLWESKHGLCGLQRKAQMDLIASVRDGRLGKELIQMAQLKAAFVVIEGSPAWDREGNLMTDNTRWTMRQQWGVVLSIQSKGYPVLQTRTPLETCGLIEYLGEWTDKDEHVSSLFARPSAPTNGWGRLDERTTAIHVYSGVPAVGPELAARLYDAGLRLLVCGVTEEQLMSVRGIGKKKARAILAAIEGKTG